MQAKVNGRTYDIELLSKEGNRVQVKLNGEVIDIDAVLSETGFCSIIHKDRSYNAECVNPAEGRYVVTSNFRRYEIDLNNPRKKYLRNSSCNDDDNAKDCIKAPMPGKVVSVMVKPGQMVKKGDPLVVMEAMKMQSTYTASQDAVVDKVSVEAGDAVLSGQTLISFEHDK